MSLPLPNPLSTLHHTGSSSFHFLYPSPPCHPKPSPTDARSFYCQNIRNNANRNRTPTWVRKAGLVDPREEQRKKAKSTWAKRYDERNNESAHVGQALEEGEEGTNYVPEDPREAERRERMRNEGLWTREDEEWYAEGELSLLWMLFTLLCGHHARSAG